MNRSFKLAIACCCMAFGQQSAAQSGGALTALVEQDVRLATIAERMLGANRDLCRQHMPLAGFVLHSRDQYNASVAGTAFADGRIAISTLVPGTAASRVLARGDAIAAIGGTRTENLTTEGDAPLRDSAFAV